MNLNEPTILVVPGDLQVRVFYTAICNNCGDPPLPIPFSDRTERYEWVKAHVTGTQHTVVIASEIRLMIPNQTRQENPVRPS
jgi:hypothetical protein